MFERYTEKARRTIFFARYEASQFGSSYIEAEHLLLGLLREDKTLATRFLGSHAVVEAIRKQIEDRTEQRDRVSTSVDLPLSQECKRALAFGAEEAERLHHKHIETVHVLLGLLRAEECFAAQLLRERGVTLDSVREAQKAEPVEQGARGPFARLDQWLTEREARGGIVSIKQTGVANRTTHIDIYAGDPGEPFNLEDTPVRVPLLCIEIIRDQRFRDLQERCDDHIAEGVAEIWLLAPNFKRAYTVTETEGFREFKGEILKIAEPPIEMDLGKIFD